MLISTNDAAQVEADLAQRIDSVLAEVNHQRNADECLAGWFATSQQLSVETGELTSTLKIRRARVEEKYKIQMDELYSNQWSSSPGT